MADMREGERLPVYFQRPHKMEPKNSVPRMPMERVWERLKERAAVHAESDSVMGMDEALGLVVGIGMEEHLKHAPGEAVEFLARELVRLTGEAIASRRLSGSKG